MQIKLLFRTLVVVASIVFNSHILSGCVSMGDVADSLSKAVLNQNDPEIVRDGLPSYLILVDSLVINEPDDAELLLAAARLNSAYAGAFVDDPERAKLIAAKALDYARRAACEELEDLCRAADKPLEPFSNALLEIDDGDDVPYLYGFATAWAGWVQANSGDWRAIADLPKIQAAIERVLVLDDKYDYGNAHVYMGVLLTLRPASLGGQPEAGRAHFERAMAISSGKNLMAMVMYAEKYARLVFDKSLHDRLLEEVLSADPKVPGLTLVNTLAQQQAKKLLDTSDDYF